jgi:Domain of unknown function (DUF1876)
MEPVTGQVALIADIWSDENYTKVSLYGVDMDFTDEPVRTPLAEGIARRDPHDLANQTIGINLAFGRALDRLSKRYNRRSAGMIRHADHVAQHRQELKETKNILEAF